MLTGRQGDIYIILLIKNNRKYEDSLLWQQTNTGVFVELVTKKVESSIHSLRTYKLNIYLLYSDLPGGI